MRNLQMCLMKQGEQDGKLTTISERLEKIEINTKILVDGRKKLTLNFFLKPDINPQENLNQSLRLRHPTTCEWLTQSCSFTEWLQTPGSRLWLNGIAGGGKTVLAGAMIQEAILATTTKPDVGVAFFFCDYKKEATLTAVNILGAIASQLALQHNDLFELLQTYYDELHPANALNKTADADELTRTIISMCDLLQQVIIVVDGLDECGDHTRKVLESLSELADFATTTTIALLSRDEVDIRQVLEDEFHSISIEAHTEDLELYVRSEMELRAQTKQLIVSNIRIKDEIQEELVTRANGMFRWVVCQLDYLGDLPTDADRRLALKELPPTLSDTYLRLLERIEKRPARVQKVVQKCLQFIAFFPHQVPVAGLCQAVSTPETIGSQIDETNTISEREILRCCSSLIRKSSDGEHLEFAHFSVREFLEGESLSQTPGLRKYSLSKSESQLQLALQCLRFLQMKEFNEFNEFNQELARGSDWEGFLLDNNNSNPFYHFASLAWLSLTKEGLYDDSVLEAVTMLFHPHNRSSFRLWAATIFLEIPSLARDDESPDISWNFDSLNAAQDCIFDGSLGPLHIASAFNLPEICSFILDKGADVNASCALGMPLLLAEISFLGLVESTIGYYPPPHSWIMTALLSSSSRRNKTINCLISAGASFSSFNEHAWEGDTGSSIFSTIAFIGCQLKDFKPLMTLLDHGVVPQQDDINTFRNDLESLSTNNDFQKLADSLLELFNYLKASNAYNSVWGFKLGEQLWLAAVALKLDFTSDPSVTDSQISLSLHALLEKAFLAIRCDDIVTLQFCLKDGRVSLSDVLDLGGEKGTLLHYAAAFDAFNCARLLLDSGWDPEITDIGGRPVVFHCDFLGDGSILKLLYNRGISPLTKGPGNFTLWHCCANGVDCEMPFLESLFNLDPALSRQARLMKSDEDQTPLMIALSKLAEADKEDFLIIEDTVLLFIGYGQKTPNFWKDHACVFPLAAATNSSKVLEHLLELGVKPDPIESGEMTPLHNLGSDATYECTEVLKNVYPDALTLRFNDRLPLELYIKRVLMAHKRPKTKLINALSFPDIFRYKDSKGNTPWEFACCLEDPVENSDLIDVLKGEEGSWKHLGFVWMDLLRHNAMKAYEDVTGQDGPRLLLKSYAYSKVELISCDTLEQALVLSKYWDPASKETLSFFKGAVYFGHLPKLNVLLKHGFDIHKRESGLSSLEYACEPAVAVNLCCDADGMDILQVLLDNSDPEKLRDFSIDPRAYSLLHRLASESSSPDIAWLVRQLVDKGADINAINPRAPASSRMSPLIWHLAMKSDYCAELLLELGADPLLTGGGVGPWATCDALLAANHRGNASFLLKLLSYSKQMSVAVDWNRCIPGGVIINRTQTVDGWNYLHSACATGKLECASFFIDQKLTGDIDSVSRSGFTPLHLAALSDQHKIIELLVSKGASIDAVSNEGRTALHYAAINGHFKSAEKLVFLDAANLVDDYTKFPRMYADELGYEAVVNLLDDAFGQTNRSNHTPRRSARMDSSLALQLKQAILVEDMEFCEELLKRGVSLNTPIPKCHGWSPLPYALIKNKKEMALWLLEKGAEVIDNSAIVGDTRMSALEIASGPSELVSVLPEILRRYLESGGDWVLGKDAPLLYVVIWKNIAGLQMILQHLVDNAAQICHISQLQCDSAVELIVNRLFYFGTKHRRARKVTALHLAVESESIVTVALLLENGANPDIVDDSGRHTLDYARTPEMIATLLHSGASPVPVLRYSLRYLLCSWENSATIATLYRDNYAKVLGFQLADILDLSAPSDNDRHFQSTLNISPDIFVAMKVMGFDPTSLGHGYGDVLNQCLQKFRSQSFFLNSEWNFEVLDSFPWHKTNQLTWVLAPFLRATFRHFRRRYSKKAFKKWMNLQPDQGWSPLCRAASQDQIEIMENCLSIGAVLDFEGCPLGSALIIASACGCTSAVKLLVRRGAAICYIGRRGPINAISVARSRTVRSWLLVGRFNDQLRIEAGDGSSMAHSQNQTSCWSGIVKARFKLRGENLIQFGESSLDYAKRLGEVRRDLRGEIITVDELVFPQSSEESI